MKSIMLYFAVFILLLMKECFCFFFESCEFIMMVLGFFLVYLWLLAFAGWKLNII